MKKQYGGKNKDIRAQQTDLEPIPVPILDRKVIVNPPHGGAIIYLSNLLGVNDKIRQAGGLVEFLCALVDEADARWISGLVLDLRSGFDIFDVEEVLADLLVEWGGNPTKPASGSGRTQGTTGKRSTATSRRATSTRQKSTPKDSSTSSTGS